MSASVKRWIIWGAIGGVIILGLAFAFRPRPLPVDIVTVERGALMVTVEDDGRTRVHDIYVISAPVAGRMRRVALRAGDQVAARKTVVAEIEPTASTFLDPRSEAQARADVQAARSAEQLARAEVQMAQAEFEFARRDYERARELIAKNTISQRDLDEAERIWRTRQASLLTSQAALDRSTYQLQRARAELVSPAQSRTSSGNCACLALRSPVDGEVLRVLQQSEAVVAASTPLVEVGDPRDLEIAADLLSADAVKVRTGQRVVIEGWGGDSPLAGRVRLVEPFGFTKVSALGIEEQRVNVIIDLTSPRAEWARLAHGYQVEVRIVLSELDDIVHVPLTALFRDGTQWAVFVEGGGRARLRHVQLGQRNGTAAQILEGLKAGERIVLHPSDRVGDGVRVAARGD